MVFGLFKKDRQPESSKKVDDVVPIPVILDDARLIELGPILWQNVRYGMMRDEVSSVRPDAVRIAEGDRLRDGATSELSIPRLKLGTHYFSVQFFFRDSQLTQVTIATNGGPNLADFRDLAGALRLRYGQEVEMKESPDSFSTAEWLSLDGVNVSLVCFPAAGVLNVNFQYRYADAAGQL